MVAPSASKLGNLLLCLNPFGNGSKTEGRRQGDGGIDDCRVVVRDPETGNEGHVDLQGVDRELLELLHRRVAGSEIIESQLHPHASQAA